MSVGKRLKEIQMLFDSCDFYLQDFYQGKTDSELLDHLKKLEQEKAIALRFNKDAQNVKDIIVMVEAIIEYRMLEKEMNEALEKDEEPTKGYTLG